QPSLLPRHNQYEISGLTACCYFAQPYHSYMIFFGSLEAQLGREGSIKHTNGLVRQFIPKRANIHEIPDDFIEQVQNSLNHRPRKILRSKTTYEVFFGKEIFSAMCFQGLHW
ncbi:MAG: hypothetical protein NT164_01985, partial [Verrucomicrobiae bacterium]|nr:hypothetical protein [Verrucomicrobiae bacterium]